MNFPSNFLPVLQPPTWAGMASCVHRPLISGKSGSPLVVAFAEVTEQANLTLNTRALDDLGVSAEEVEDAARRNWLARFSDIQWESAGDEDSGIRLLCARPMGDAGDAFSSGIAVAEVLGELHRLLGGEMFYVAVPDRLTIMASDSPLLAGVASGMFGDAVESGSVPLSPHTFVVQNGKLVGFGQVEGDTAMDPGQSGLTEMPPAALPGLVAACVILVRANGRASAKALARMFAALEAHQTEAPGTITAALSRLFLSDHDAHLSRAAACGDFTELFTRVAAGRDAVEKALSPEQAADYQQFILRTAAGMAGADRFFRKGKPTKNEAGALQLLRAILE